MQLWTASGAVLSAVLLTAGCGGGDEDELRSAVERYSSSFLAGDADATYDLLSERCQKRLPVLALQGITSSASKTYGQQPITRFTVDELSDNLARVSYGYEDARIDQEKEPWVREGDSWRQDDC